MSRFLVGMCGAGSSVIITFPCIIITMLRSALTYADFYFVPLLLISGIYVVFKTVHLYLDAQLFGYLGLNNSDMRLLDEFLLGLFKKQQNNKPLETRINNTMKQVRFFLKYSYFIGCYFSYCLSRSFLNIYKYTGWNGLK